MDDTRSDDLIQRNLICLQWPDTVVRGARLKSCRADVGGRAQDFQRL